MWFDFLPLPWDKTPKWYRSWFRYWYDRKYDK